MGQGRPSIRPPLQHQQPSLHERTLELEETFQQFMQVQSQEHKGIHLSYGDTYESIGTKVSGKIN